MCIRILQSREILDRVDRSDPAGDRRRDPGGSALPPGAVPRSRADDLSRPYPFARIPTRMPSLPVEIELEALLAVRASGCRGQSGLPAIIFTFTVRNLLDRHAERLARRHRSRTRSAGTGSRPSPASTTRSTAET